MFLVYLSRMLCSAPDVAQIVEAARVHNAAAGLTGLLLNDRRHFLQFLEGPKEPLSATLLRIAGDPRHIDLTILACEPMPARIFTSWSLASQPFGDRRSTLAGFAGGLLSLGRTERMLRLQEFGLAHCPPAPAASREPGA